MVIRVRHARPAPSLMGIAAVCAAATARRAWTHQRRSRIARFSVHRVDHMVMYTVSGRLVMPAWLRRLFPRRPAPGRAPIGAREVVWLARSAVPTVADEEARQRAEEQRAPSEPHTPSP